MLNYVLMTSAFRIRRTAGLFSLLFIGGVTTHVHSQEPDAAAFYNTQEVQDIHIDVLAADMRKLHAALPKRIYVPAVFRWRGVTLSNTAIRYKGNSSSTPWQPFKRSFLIKFGEFQPGQSFLGLKRVALDNGIQFGSLFSERIVTDILHELNVPASRCNYARLHLNGKYHGVYVNVERIDTAFVNNRFGGEPGPLYKVHEGGPGGTLSPVPEENRRDMASAFEPKSKTASDDAKDVFGWIERFHRSSPETFREDLEETLALENFLKTTAVMLYAGAFDQLTGWNPHNYYLYRNPEDDRWHYLPWDLDVGFADNAFGKIPVLSEWHAAWPIPGGPPKPLLERIVDDERLLNQYRVLADGILEKHFHPDVLLPKFDALYAQIRNDLAADPFPKRRITNPRDVGYDDIVASMKSFASKRYQLARGQLNNPGNKPVRRKPAPGREPAPGEPSDDAPTELRLVAQTDQGVELQWVDNAEGEVAHVVQRTKGGKGVAFFNCIGKPGPRVTSATDRNVRPGETYQYRVYAVHPTQNGPRGTGISNVITVKIKP